MLFFGALLFWLVSGSDIAQSFIDFNLSGILVAGYFTAGIGVFYLLIAGAWQAIRFVAKLVAKKDLAPLKKISGGPLLIIGVFSLFLLGSLTTCGCGARDKARDAKRMSDMRQMVAAQEMYYQSNNQYFRSSIMPVSLDTYMQNVPADPSGNNTSYGTVSNITSPGQFCYYAALENEKMIGSAGYKYYVASNNGNFYLKTIPATLEECGQGTRPQL